MPENSLCVLQNRLARGEEIKVWAALRAAPPSRKPEQVYQIARTYFTKGMLEEKDLSLAQEKGVKGENELRQRITVLNW